MSRQRFFHSAAFIARKDVAYALRHRETIVWVFVMPIVFFYFIGTVTGGFGAGGAQPEGMTLVTPADAGLLADQVERRLTAQGFAVERAVQAGAEVRRRLELPPALTASALEGGPAKLRFVRRGGGLGAEQDELRVTRAVYTLLADLAVLRAEGREPDAAGFQALAERPRQLRLEVRPAGERRRIPTGFEQTIPGTLVMFTMLVLLTSGAVPLVVEREQGVLRRLASAPVPRGAVVLGKWAGKMALGLVQIGFAMLAGTLLFRMAWGGSLPAVVLVLVAWASVNASLGLLLGSLARTEAQAVAVGVVSSMAFGALGGCWWPIEITPEWMQRLALFLPSGWTMDAMHRLVSFGEPAAAALPHVLALGLLALGLGRFAIRRFRFV